MGGRADRCSGSFVPVVAFAPKPLAVAVAASSTRRAKSNLMAVRHAVHNNIKKAVSHSYRSIPLWCFAVDKTGAVQTAWRLFNATTFALMGNVAENTKATKELHDIINDVCECLS